MKVLEINDNDIYGKIFNGYEIMENLNNSKDFQVKQLVINKLSSNPNCVELFPNYNSINNDFYLHVLEHDIMSTHSLLSSSTLMLKNNKYYNKCDLAHFHQVHNCRFSLPTFFDLAKKKPTVISFHDPWFMTGRCVHTLDCEKWKTGCTDCMDLSTLFDLPYDNCSELWKIKSELANTDVDIIVHSKFMYDLAKENPYTKNLRIHEVPLGIDLSKYNFKLSKEEAKKKLNIFPSNIVIFFREQQELKGTNFIVEALKQIKNKNNITLLTCSQTGLLKEIEDDFNIIELGTLDEEDVLLCYNASDIFLMPSLGESFGMMAVEAMAAGIPTIVFDNSALPDTTGAPDVGILVKNLDADDLYKKIDYYINNPTERIQRGNLSKEYVAKKYDYNSFFNNISKVYKEAYENQKYKLKKKKISEIKTIDFSNQNVKKTISKLDKIFDEFFIKKAKPNFLKQESLTDNNISYSDKNVINLIEKFNNYIYKAIKNNSPIKPIPQPKLEIVDSEAKQNKEPKVSIIIPVYNGASYVALAIDSALRQTYANKEIIVVDDGSTDDTEKVCASFGNLIKYIKKENGGVSTALNVGIKNMTGEYFSWLSHDDLYYPDKLSTEVEYLKKNDLIGTNTILYSNFSLFDEFGILLNDIFFDTNVLNKDSAFAILKGGIDGLTLLIPKKAFEEVGFFDENLRCIQDYQLWLDMYKFGYKFIHIPNVLAATRLHSNSVTSTSPKVVTEGNKFWVDAIKYFSDEDKIKLYGSVYNYYYDLYNFFNYGPYNEAVEYCEKKYHEIEDLNKNKIKDIKVTVIIPFHNYINRTCRAINSVLNQTHKNIEIIIINNCSSDDISKITNLINNNDQIKLITLNTKSNNAVIWNEGIKNSTGDYIAFLEQDNFFEPTKIEIQLMKMVSSGDVISHTSYHDNSNHKSNYINSGYQSGYVLSSLINECYINISTVMLYRPYLTENNILFNEMVAPAEDICFYFEMLKSNRILGIQKPLTTVYDKSDAIDELEKTNSLISYVYSNDRFNDFPQEKSKLLQSYINILNSTDDKNMRLDELERSRYLQSKSFKITNKIRTIYAKLTHKEYRPIYLLNLYTLQHTRLYSLYKLYKKLRKKG